MLAQYLNYSVFQQCSDLPVLLDILVQLDSLLLLGVSLGSCCLSVGCALLVVIHLLLALFVFLRGLNVQPW